MNFYIINYFLFRKYFKTITHGNEYKKLFGRNNFTNVSYVLLLERSSHCKSFFFNTLNELEDCESSSINSYLKR